MEARELRIGNDINVIAKSPSETMLITGGKITSIRKDCVYVNGIKVKISNIKPIPLTEAILLKCGFAKCTHHKSYFHEDLEIYLSVNTKKDEVYALHELNQRDFWGNTPKSCYDGKYYITSESEYLVSDKPVEYVHQLQNLYFVLTGKELTVEQLLK